MISKGELIYEQEIPFSKYMTHDFTLTEDNNPIKIHLILKYNYYKPIPGVIGRFKVELTDPDGKKITEEFEVYAKKNKKTSYFELFETSPKSGKYNLIIEADESTNMAATATLRIYK